MYGTMPSLIVFYIMSYGLFWRLTTALLTCVSPFLIQLNRMNSRTRPRFEYVDRGKNIVAVGFVDFLLSSSIAWCSLEVRRSVQQQTALFTAVRPPARAPGNPKESHNKITFGENILYSYTQIAGCLWRNQMASSWISLTNLKHMRYD